MSVHYLNPEGMHRSPVFSQGIILPANARILLRYDRSHFESLVRRSVGMPG